jgi:diguanylate cyclase (GGDEF)-like protein
MMKNSNSRNDHQDIGRSSRLRFVLIGILLITTIIGAAATLHWMQRNDAIAAYRTATSNLGYGMSQQTAQAINSVDRALHEIEANLTSAPEATSEQIGLVMRTRATFDLLVSSSKGASFSTGLAIVDVDGEIRNSTGDWTFMGGDVSREDFFLHVSTDNDDNSFVSVPTKSEASGEWTTYLSRRINDVHGAFAGAAVARISLTSIEEFYSNAMPPHRSVSLVRRDGMVLVRFPHREDEIGKIIPAHTPWYAAVAQGGGAYHASDYFTPTPIIAFARPLENLPLVVQASVTEADVLADWPRQLLWLVLGAAAAIIGLVLLLRHLAGQVDRLERSGAVLASKNLELEAAHSQLDATLANISLGVCFFSGDRKLILSNQRYSEIYNLPPEAVRPGTSVVELMGYMFAAGRSPDVGRAEYVSFRDKMIESGQRQQAVIELTSGQSVFVTHQPMPHKGWISTHEDITERREADRRIRFLAHHDALTGLLNRALFAEKLDEAVARLRRNGEPFSVLMMDLDKFKNVNDTLGHPAGDQLLRETARRLKSSLRDTDVLARLGGDEFVIVQSGEENPSEGAAGMATRILKNISKPYDIDGHVVFVGASIGIALAPENADNGPDILKMADLALYAVKTAGRNDFRFFEAEMLADAVAA